MQIKLRDFTKQDSRQIKNLN